MVEADPARKAQQTIAGLNDRTPRGRGPEQLRVSAPVIGRQNNVTRWQLPAQGAHCNETDYRARCDGMVATILDLMRRLEEHRMGIVVHPRPGSHCGNCPARRGRTAARGRTRDRTGDLRQPETSLYEKLPLLAPDRRSIAVASTSGRERLPRRKADGSFNGQGVVENLNAQVISSEERARPAPGLYKTEPILSGRSPEYLVSHSKGIIRKDQRLCACGR